MPDISSTVQLMFQESDRRPSGDDPLLPYKDVDELRWGEAFDVPLRFMIGEIDLFSVVQPPGDGYPHARPVHLLDLVIQLAQIFERDDPSGNHTLDPWEAYDYVDVAVADGMVTFSLNDAPLGSAALADVISASHAFYVCVRQVIASTHKDFLTHPQIGPWLRSESIAPSDEDLYCCRRSAKTVEFVEHDDDLAREKEPEDGYEALLSNDLSIGFSVDQRVVDDGRKNDLAKESDRSLVECFFQMPVSIVAGDRQLLHTIFRSADGTVTEIAARACPLLRLVFDLDDIRDYLLRVPESRVTMSIKDVDGRRDLKIGFVVDGVYLQRCEPWAAELKPLGPRHVVPHAAFLHAVRAFTADVIQFFDAVFPDVFDRTLPGLRWQLVDDSEWQAATR